MRLVLGLGHAEHAHDGSTRTALLEDEVVDRPHVLHPPGEQVVGGRHEHATTALSRRREALAKERRSIGLCSEVEQPVFVQRIDDAQADIDECGH